MMSHCKSYVVEHSSRLTALETNQKDIRIDVHEIKNALRWQIYFLIFTIAALTLDLLRYALLR